MGILKKYEVDEEKVLQDAIDTFGIEKQLIVTIEELSELQKTIAEYLRYNKSDEYVGEIIEELVDAEIMIRQVKKMFKMDEFYHMKFYLNKKRTASFQQAA